MVTKAERDRKNANAEFGRMMDRSVTHLRVGQGREDRTAVTLLGLASELHGLDGLCTCCPRRPAGEPSARESAAAAARAAARRAAELDPTPAAPMSIDVPLDVDQRRTAAIAQARAAAVDSAERLSRQQ